MRAANKVLLVEDNHDIREVFAMILATFGYDVTECAEGLTAIEKATELRPDVAIIDVGLPDIDGFGVACGLRELEMQRGQGERAILVALTGRDGAPTRRQTRKAGFDLYFTKPVELKTIHADIQTRVAERTLQRDAA